MIAVLGWSTDGAVLTLEAQPSNGGPKVPVRLSQDAAEQLFDALQAALEADFSDAEPAEAWGAA